MESNIGLHSVVKSLNPSRINYYLHLLFTLRVLPFIFISNKLKYPAPLNKELRYFIKSLRFVKEQSAH